MNIRVLIVDDEQDFAESLAERLETRGFDAAAEFDGARAMDRMQKEEFDVVVLDVVMPGLNGMEALREIKKMSPLTEVIMLTGQATVETAIEGMKLGAFDYLMKPTETEELVEKLKTAHQRRAQQVERIKKAEIDEIIRRRGW